MFLILTLIMYILWNICCSSLIDLDITNFYIEPNTYIDDIFEGCTTELKDKIKQQNKKLPKRVFGYF